MPTQPWDVSGVATMTGGDPRGPFPALLCSFFLRIERMTWFGVHLRHGLIAPSPSGQGRCALRPPPGIPFAWDELRYDTL